MIKPRIDWFRLMVDLDRAGYPGRRVSSELKIPYPTLKSRAYHDAEPRFQDGEALVNLWVSVLGRDPSLVPRRAKQGRQLTADDR